MTRSVAALSALLIAALLYFAYQTPAGYLLTLSLHGFEKTGEREYFDLEYVGDKTALRMTVRAAVERNRAFWGTLEAEPTIVVSDQPDKLSIMQWAGNPALTMTIVLGGIRSYIIIDPSQLDIDVTAHEWMHAEMAARMYGGRLMLTERICPIWFEEGAAMQLDYRDGYGEAAREYFQSVGIRETPLASLQTYEQFFTEDSMQRAMHYIQSKNELEGWLDDHGVEGLAALLEKLGQGESFYESYYHINE